MSVSNSPRLRPMRRPCSGGQSRSGSTDVISLTLSGTATTHGRNETRCAPRTPNKLAQSQRSADGFQALTEALAVAKEAAETYRAQLTTASTSTAKSPVSANSQPLGCHSNCDMVDHARHFARVRGAQARPFTRPRPNFRRIVGDQITRG